MTDNGWMPIETATPEAKDGREVLGCAVRKYGNGTVYASGPWTMAFNGKDWVSSWDGTEVIGYMGDFGTDYKGTPDCPTHWMPLPSTPEPTP